VAGMKTFSPSAAFPVFALAVSLIATAPESRADLTLVQQIEQPGRKDPMVMTTKIQGAMVRSEISPDMTVIMDSRTGETTTLMKSQKMAMTLPGAVVKAAQAAAMGNVANAASVEPVATGRTETINGFKCRELTVAHEGKQVEVWVTDDIPDAEGIMAQLAMLSADANPVADALGGAKISGFPIRTSVGMGPLGKVTMTVVSLNRDDLPAEDFLVPKGFKKVAMPAIPGLPGM